MTKSLPMRSQLGLWIAPRLARPRVDRGRVPTVAPALLFSRPTTRFPHESSSPNPSPDHRRRAAGPTFDRAFPTLPLTQLG